VTPGLAAPWNEKTAQDTEVYDLARKFLRRDSVKYHIYIGGQCSKDLQPRIQVPRYIYTRQQGRNVDRNDGDEANKPDI
jgi:hypothetical protein